MHIAVVGAGIFGITSAVKLAQGGHRVDLFEKEKDILMAASGINQFRLHRGYHYPRSEETIKECMRTETGFLKEYGSAVISSDHHYYCISREDSLIHHSDYIRVCKNFGLDFIEDRSGLVNGKISLTIKADEKRIDPIILKKICYRKIRSAGVNLRLGEAATNNKLNKYDFAVIAAYASINSLLPFHKQRDYQFELCEKPVVKLPREFSNKCLVIMDGPFMCIDPFGRTGNFLLGNVVHAIHQTNIGENPEFDKKFKPLLNKGLIRNPPVTNFKKFIESGTKFIPELAKARHIGSMFTFRTVLPRLEKTDARPTLVSRIDNKTAAVFSGKISSCVEAAEKVAAMAKELDS